MTLSPARHSTAADLLRLLAIWLAVVLALQGWHAAQAGARGPLHRHDRAGPGHVHAEAQRHFHWHAAEPVLQQPVADWDDLAFALTAALALMALGRPRRMQHDARHVQRPAPAWRPRTTITAPPERPPRPA